MTNYRRTFVKGGYYFFAVVSYDRQRFFHETAAREILHKVFDEVRNKRPFEIIAMVLLPEHLHCVWKLPEGDSDFSTRWRLIKTKFTKTYLGNGGKEILQSNSRKKKQQRGIWQRRFWEHRIRDRKDLQRHIDYIHYNPIKHNLVKDLANWPWSTYHKYIESGKYSKAYFTDIQEELNEMFVYERQKQHG